MVFSRKMAISLALLASAISTGSQATLFNVQLIDTDGLHVGGFVDTTSDTFSITSWILQPGGTLTAFTPVSSEFPLVWNARQANGSPFDVPDDWDGTIGITWGFLSPVPIEGITWIEGATSAFGTVPGWGIGGFPITSNLNENVFESIPVSSSNQGRVFFDQVRVSMSLPATIWAMGLGFSLLLLQARTGKHSVTAHL